MFQELSIFSIIRTMLVCTSRWTVSMWIVEDCFTPWLIHDEGEIIFIIFKEFIFRSFYFILLRTWFWRSKNKFLEDNKYNFTFIMFQCGSPRTGLQCTWRGGRAQWQSRGPTAATGQWRYRYCMKETCRNKIALKNEMVDINFKILQSKYFNYQKYNSN